MKLIIISGLLVLINAVPLSMVVSDGNADVVSDENAIVSGIPSAEVFKGCMAVKSVPFGPVKNEMCSPSKPDCWSKNVKKVVRVYRNFCVKKKDRTCEHGVNTCRKVPPSGEDAAKVFIGCMSGMSVPYVHVKDACEQSGSNDCLSEDVSKVIAVYNAFCKTDMNCQLALTTCTPRVSTDANVYIGCMAVKLVPFGPVIHEMCSPASPRRSVDCWNEDVSKVSAVYRGFCPILTDAVQKACVVADSKCENAIVSGEDAAKVFIGCMSGESVPFVSVKNDMCGLFQSRSYLCLSEDVSEVVAVYNTFCQSQEMPMQMECLLGVTKCTPKV